MSTNSRNDYTADGATDTFSITFEFDSLKPEEVLVYADGVLQVTSTDYNIVGTNVVFVSNPANEVWVSLRRATGKTELVDFSAKSVVDNADLDLMYEQLLRLAQEGTDEDSSQLYDGELALPADEAMRAYDKATNTWTAGHAITRWANKVTPGTSDTLLIGDAADSDSLKYTTVGQIMAAAGAGDVVGPSSSTDNAVARFDTTTGKLLQNSTVTLSDAGVMAGASISAASNTITEIEWNEFSQDMKDRLLFGTGGTLDSADITVTSDGATITCTVEKAGGGDIRVMFDSAAYVFDTSPAVTVSLTAGTDEVPVENFVYLDGVTKLLTVSTSGWPATLHARFATVVCQTAATLQTEGAYKVHVWTDHMTGSDTGHLAHVNEWIRSQPATWISGVAPTTTITTNGGSEDDVDFATTAGEVLQLHGHDFPAFDTDTLSSDLYIVNKDGAAYTKITNLNECDEDSNGNALVNNNRTNLVIWGVASEDD